MVGMSSILNALIHEQISVRYWLGLHIRGNWKFAWLYSALASRFCLYTLIMVMVEFFDLVPFLAFISELCLFIMARFWLALILSVIFIYYFWGFPVFLFPALYMVANGLGLRITRNTYVFALPKFFF